MKKMKNLLPKMACRPIKRPAPERELTTTNRRRRRRRTTIIQRSTAGRRRNALIQGACTPSTRQSNTSKAKSQMQDNKCPSQRRRIACCFDKGYAFDLMLWQTAGAEARAP